MHRYVVALLSVCVLLVNTPASAATIRVVTTTADTNDGTCDSNCSLREAIAAADSGDTINFSGVALPATITLALGQLLVDGKNLVINGPGADQLAIDGNHASRIFKVKSSLTLSGVTIQSANSEGGALHNAGGTLALTDCTLSGNSTNWNGGGIYNEGSVTLTNCALSGNSAGRDAGAIYNKGAATLTGCTLSNNSAGALADWSYGGAIENHGTLVLTDCTLSGNSVMSGSRGFGGAICNSIGTTTLTRCTLSGNSAGYTWHEGYGGAVANPGYIYPYNGTVQLTDCTLNDNSATIFGGAVSNYYGSVSLTRCTLHDNQASSGGAVGGRADLTDCTLQNNRAARDGGAKMGGGNLTNCTLTGNTAGHNGGAIADGGTLINCTLNGNTAGGDGGAITGRATLTDCTLNGNTAGGNGGAIAGAGTLTNCTVNGNTAGSGGGGMWADDTVTLTGCTLSDNVASNGDGGGLASHGPTAALTDCTLTGNSADSGGGLYNNVGGTATLTSCTLSTNSAIGAGGGVVNFGTARLTDCVLSDGTAAVGGGIANEISYSQGRWHGSTAALANCTLRRNTSSGDGGGMHIAGGTAMLSNCTLSGNIAGGSGGAIDNRGKLDVSASTLDANTAALGGALAHEAICGSDLSPAHCFARLINSTLSGNASDSGGGIYNDAGGKLLLQNCTLNGNAANAGGGIFNASKFAKVKNTILTNSPSGGNCAGTYVREYRSLEDGQSCGFRGRGCTRLGAGSLCNTDPKLAPAGLADNGGPTLTIALQADSPATRATLHCPRTDQRTFARPGIDPATNRPSRFCTMGAYEPDSSGCRTEHTLCSDTCVDLRKDPSNCGTCASVCAAGQKCSKGVCK